MEKTLNLFRVFDLAFFVPGAVLLAGLWRTGALGTTVTDARDSSSDTLQAIGLGVLAVLASFLLGLLCHSVYRLVHLIAGRLAGEATEPSWYNALVKDRPQHELAIYFWYLRATCWNTAVACVIVCPLMACVGSATWALVCGVGTVVFLFLGYDFNAALKRAIR